MKSRTKKIILLAFLAFIVIGFTAPLVSYTFFEGNQDTNSNLPEQLKNPKLCNTDTDCTLTCTPPSDPVLCIQNICAQTACDQAPLFYYNQVPTRFTLDIVINNTNIPSHLPLIVDPKNTFVQTQGDAISVFSGNMPLIGILEKVGITFNQNCMVYHTTQYCQDENNVLDLRINGNASTLDYSPQDDDIIILSYSKVQPKNIILPAPIEQNTTNSTAIKQANEINRTANTSQLKSESNLKN